jgi:outer membrane protein assembly factor BamA
MRPFRLVWVLLLLASFAFGEAADHYQLARVVLRGSSRYSEPDLLRAAGLKIDSQVTAADLQNAAQRLNDTGVFSTVQYLFKPVAGTLNGVEADFDLADASKFLPAKFDNFLWFSQEDLQIALHNSLPLYNGELPLSGGLPDAVSAALSSMLSARKLPSEVSYLLAGEKDRPPSEYLFKVEHAGLKVAAFNFTGVARMDPALVTQALAPLKGTDFLHSIVEGWVKSKVTTLYRQNGYLQASVEVKPSLGENGAVAVNLEVKEGTQYRVAGFSWTGNTLLSGDELSKHLSMKEGEPANSVKLEGDLARVTHLFWKFGHEAAHIQPVAIFRGESVLYTLQVTEGELYHMGKLEVLAPDPYRQKVMDIWKLREGAAYDNTYFLQVVDQIKKLVPGGARWEWKAREQVDQVNKTVNVQLEVATK